MLWQASVDDETAIAQASEEFSSFLNGFAALVDVPDRLQFIGKVPQLQYMTKLLVVFRIAWERTDDRLRESLQELWHNIVPIAGVTVAIGGLALVAPQIVVPVLEILNVIGTGVAGYQAYQSFSEFLTLLNHAQDEDDLSQAADELLNTVGNLAFFALGAIGFVKSLPYLRTLLATVLQKLKSFPEALIAEALPLLKSLFSRLGETLRPVLEGTINAVRSGQVLVELINHLDVWNLLRSLSSNGAWQTIFTMERGLDCIDSLSHLISKLDGSEGLQGLKTFLEGAEEVQLTRLMAIDQRLQMAENATVMELLQPNSPLVKTILEAETGVEVVDALGYLTGLVGKNEKLLECLNGANADILNALVQVAEGLKQNSSVRQALSQCPDLIGVILKSGVEAIEPLAQLLAKEGMTPQLLMNLLDQEGMSIESCQALLNREDITAEELLELFDEEEMTLQEIKDFLGDDAKPTVGARGNCFIGGTNILTTNGEKRIEDIQVGDWVIADNPDTPGNIEARQVSQTFIRHTDKLFDLHVGNEIISTTAEHPFWVANQGWIKAKDLQVGMQLQNRDENGLDINGIESREGEFTVYNLKVEDFHTYFVSHLGILVHNTNCGYGMSANVPDLRGLSRQQVRVILEENSFQPSNLIPSENGWQKFKHPDGSQIDINWQKGRIVRTEAPVYGSNGSRINKGQRLAFDGSRIPRDLPHEQHPPEYFDTNL